MSVQPNMRVLRRSRKKPRQGDVFAMFFPDERYLFGRVITDRARWTEAEGANRAILIYVYRVRSEVKELPSRVQLRYDQLLVPPMMTNRLPWSRGYFETIASLPLDDNDVLRQHCFSDASMTGKYFDEEGNELPHPVEPVGDYGLHSFRTIDDEISDALGLERATD